jgi:TolB-like protein
LSLFNELKRRNVFRVAIAYIIMAWLVMQVADVILNNIVAPGWVFHVLLLFLAIGLPFAVFFAWAFELTPEGLKREHEVDRQQPITSQSGRKLDRTIIVVLLLAVAWFAWDRFRVEEPASQQESMEQQTSASANGAGHPSTPVVAVLPFKATGSDDGGFLASGLHHDLLTRLAKLNAFSVLSRTSMMEYADTTKNMRQIGEELGAGYILEGGVQSHGDRVRINAQLIDAPADKHLWAEIYNRELTAANLFDIQAELAVAIANELQATLSPADRKIVEDVPTLNTAAYNAYLRGLQLWETRGYVGTRDRDAVEAFEEAVRLDPEFALAWARLSTARIRVAAGSSDPKIPEAALTALAKSRALQPGLLEAELAWAEYLYRVMFEYGQALEALEALGERAAGSVDAMRLRAWLNRRLGRYEEAYSAMQQASRLEPRSASTFMAQVGNAILLNDCESAGRHSERALSLAPNSPDVRTRVAQYELECTGNARRASDLLREVEFAVWDTFNAAWIAALHERDFERALTLAEIELSGTGSWGPVFSQLRRSETFRDLGQDEPAARRALDTAGERLEALEQNEDLLPSEVYAGTKIWYHSMRGDADAVIYWIGEHKRRFRNEFKGDRAQESRYHLYYAWSLADAGLHDEAVAELRTMLEAPGGHRFPYADGLPAFDVLEDHPGYVELRERFGNTSPK